MRRTRRERMLTFRSGGWLLLLVLVAAVAVGAWRVVPMLRSGSGAIGDGRSVDSYGFDLSNFALDRSVLVAAGVPRDGIPAMSDPPVMPIAEMAAYNETHRGEYMVPDDRVVVVKVGEHVRAYPIRLLNWHELVHDTLGGVPLLITYHPLCDAVVVYDRRVDGRVLEFGHSGLLWNSNALHYDRSPEASVVPSLWSQLQGRAVSGPHAERGSALRVVPSWLTTYGALAARFPDATIPIPEDDRKLKRYQRRPYDNYLRTGKLRFPVTIEPHEDWRVRMTPMLRVDGALVDPAAFDPAWLDGEADVRWALRFAMRAVLGEVTQTSRTP